MAISAIPSSLDLPHWFTQRAEARLQLLYGDKRTPQLMERLIDLIQGVASPQGSQKTSRWREHDIILITYGDSITQADEAPLLTLYEFLDLHLRDTINCVHILPYFPFSSDDGFAVIDYRIVNPALGTWDDIERISQAFDLMTDLVINHVSRENPWFVDYLDNTEPGCDYFIEMAPNTDVSGVVRPRSSPLLMPAHTRAGIRHVWATFSEDQIDVAFRNPDVLFEFIEILLLYLAKGSRFIRLDAIAFVWKQIGTRCINLRETHGVVKLLRDILDVAAPGSVLITETNLPNGENISYFGNSDEAHMVYQFTLPPLLLHALYEGDGRYLSAWTKDNSRPPKGCTFLNFIASHDGIGLRPAEGILPPSEVRDLVDSMHQYGGFVSMKANGDGVDTPYEINIALFDALRGTRDGEDQWQKERFICAHAVMLALQGIPAFYINSLVAAPNDLRGVEQTGRTRTINRRKWDYAELMKLLSNPDSHNADVFHELKHFIQVRRKQPAFHPEADQETTELGPGIFAIWRASLDKNQKILAASNLTNRPQAAVLPPHPNPAGSGIWRELINASAMELGSKELTLQPYQTIWLEALD